MPKTDIFLRFLTSIEERGLYITEKIGKKKTFVVSFNNVETKNLNSE